MIFDGGRVHAQNQLDFGPDMSPPGIYFTSVNRQVIHQGHKNRIGVIRIDEAEQGLFVESLEWRDAGDRWCGWSLGARAPRSRRTGIRRRSRAEGVRTAGGRIEAHRSRSTQRSDDEELHRYQHSINIRLAAEAVQMFLVGRRARRTMPDENAGLIVREEGRLIAPWDALTAEVSL